MLSHAGRLRPTHHVARETQRRDTEHGHQGQPPQQGNYRFNYLIFDLINYLIMIIKKGAGYRRRRSPHRPRGTQDRLPAGAVPSHLHHALPRAQQPGPHP